MILSIESSCDDSSVALTSIADYKLVRHYKISQDAAHSRYGGVVPEIASRLHCEALPRILARLKNEGVDFGAIKAIAVTNEPGLSVSLIEGVMMAKALSLSLQIPLIAVNHLKGHIYSLFLGREATMPLAILLLSGGHSMILEAYGYSDIRVIAESMDDSFGEAFDKVAKMLHLGYPGGPIVESYARNAQNTSAPSFPIPLKDSKHLAFSFSGLKNAVRVYLDGVSAMKHTDFTQSAPFDDRLKSAVCATFQHSAITHITQKMRLYLARTPLKTLGIVGGASANQALRDAINALAREFDKEILLAPKEFCSDNAAMIGRCAIEAYRRGEFTALNALDISPKSRF